MIIPSVVCPSILFAVNFLSLKPIFVDMEAGYALDGFGSRDTLVNVHQVHGFKQDGDKGFGSSADDGFFLGRIKRVSVLQ